MSSSEIAAQIEALKNQLAEVKTKEKEATKEQRVSEAKAKGAQLVEEADKAATMLQRAESGQAFDSPSNPSRPRKGRVLPDGRIVPLGRGKPSPNWKIVDLASVDPSQIVVNEPETQIVVNEARPTVPSNQDDKPVTFVLHGSGKAVEHISE